MTTPAPRFELPGRWGRIDLATEASVHRSTRQLLSELTNKRDDLAELRAELRRRFEKAALAARSAGATDFYIAFNLTPKVPLPAWVSVFLPEIESTDFAALGLGELSAFIDAGTRGWGGDGSSTVSGALEADGISMHAVRHSWRRVAEIEEGETPREVEFIEADYWIAAREPNRLALLTFSTALAEYEEEMLALFDAIVSTLRWPAPAAADA